MKTKTKMRLEVGGFYENGRGEKKVIFYYNRRCPDEFEYCTADGSDGYDEYGNHHSLIRSLGLKHRLELALADEDRLPILPYK